jgi:hypothetical protein
MNRMTQRIISMALAILAMSSFAFGKLSKEERDLCQKWKLWKVEQSGKEIEPKNTRFLIDIKKNKTFSITLNYEIAHRGTWEYARQTLIFHDLVTNKDMVLPVSTLDHTHLIFKGFDGQEVVTHMAPIVNKDAIHLTHREHLLVRKWTIYNSSVSEVVGSVYDFHEDKSFDYYFNGQSVAASTGKWSLSEDSKTIVLEIKRGEKVVWDVIELHRHELVAKSQSSGTLNRMHDPYLTEKDNHQLSGNNDSNTAEEVQDAVDGASK